LGEVVRQGLEVPPQDRHSRGGDRDCARGQLLLDETAECLRRGADRWHHVAFGAGGGGAVARSRKVSAGRCWARQGARSCHRKTDMAEAGILARPHLLLVGAGCPRPA